MPDFPFGREAGLKVDFPPARFINFPRGKRVDFPPSIVGLLGWKYRKRHEILGSTAGVQTDYQIKIKTLYNREPSSTFQSSVLDQYITLNAWDSQGRLFAIKKDTDGYFKLFWASDGDPDNLVLRWTPPINFSNPAHIRCLFIDSRGYIFIGAQNPTSGQIGWLWRSTDDGLTFTQVLNIAVWGMAEDSNGYLYVGRYENGISACEVYKSTDAGETWTNISDPNWTAANGYDHVHSVLIDPSTDWLYVALGDFATYEGVWRSKLKDGSDWVFKGPSDRTDYQFVGMEEKDGYIYLGSDRWDGCIWRFQDDGTDAAQTFTVVHDNPIDKHIFYLKKDNAGRLWAGILNNEVGGTTKLLTSDDGTTWVERIVHAQTYPWETFQWGTTKFSTDNILLIQYDRQTLKAWFGPPPDEVNLHGHCRTDFGDVRFTSDDGITEIPYWMEEKVDGDYAIFWVKVPSIPASPDTVTIYIYYGNPSATTTSNGEATFPDLFDHFDNGQIDNPPWVEAVDASESGTEVKIGDAINDYDYIRTSNTLFTPGKAVRARVKITNTTTAGWLGLKPYGTDGDEMLNGMGWEDATKVCRFTYVNGATYNKLYYDGDPRNVYKIYEIAWAPNKLVFYADGETNEATSDLPDDPSFAIRFVAYDANQYVYVDWVFIRKFVDPEPSHGEWGSEESL